MVYRRPKFAPSEVNAYPSRRTRIKIPQNPTRPLQVNSKDLLKREDIRQDPSWFVKHKRGPRRPKVGEDVLEARAVSKYQVKGTLPERILYKALVNLIHLTPGVDFDFQSSQSGGRMELGGLVADFLFFFMKMVIQVQGPTHTDFLRARKDEEQKAILEDMGYRVFDIDLEMVYNEYRFEEWLRRLFNLNLGTTSGGTSQVYYGDTLGPGNQLNTGEEESGDEKAMGNILDLLDDCINIVRGRY